MIAVANSFVHMDAKSAGDDAPAGTSAVDYLMAERGTRLLTDPGLWARMSAAGRARAVDLFRADRVVPQYEEFYAEVLDS